MALMKKDMGGAASALAFALLVMRAKLPMRLRVLIPAAENRIAGNAFRPGDVLTSRNGMTVEIGNTDAEGRLVLADAISLADEEAPDYLITIATLTGAARVALGPDLPPLYSNDDDFAAGLLAAAARVGDPMWRMPFWAPYDKMLKSPIADVNHIAEGSLCRLGDCRAVPQALRGRGQALRPSRYFRLGAARAAGASARRRAASRSRAIRVFPQRVRDVMSGVLPDPRRHAYRADLAAESLRGRVEAPRYVKGERRQVEASSLPLAPRAALRCDLDTEALVRRDPHPV